MMRARGLGKTAGSNKTSGDARCVGVELKLAGTTIKMVALAGHSPEKYVHWPLIHCERRPARIIALTRTPTEIPLATRGECRAVKDLTGFRLSQFGVPPSLRDLCRQKCTALLDAWVPKHPVRSSEPTHSFKKNWRYQYAAGP